MNGLGGDYDEKFSQNILEMEDSSKVEERDSYTGFPSRTATGKIKDIGKGVAIIQDQNNPFNSRYRYLRR